jgi:hypothetical protein
MNPAPRAVRSAYWTVPSLLCLLIYWRGFTAWFRADDFAWLGLATEVHSFRDLLGKLFLPAAQGTFRPWSERAFFMAGFSLFGLDAMPFRIVIFATQFANLVLVAAIGSRLTGRRAAGFWAALFWVVNAALIEPLGWACVYNQVMCAFFLLLAFYFLLRSVEAANAADGRLAKRYELLQWATFLLGFGVQELNLVYPALAAGYTFWFARPQFRRTLPMFAVSAIYLVGHNIMAPIQRTGDYAMHFTGSVFRTLGKYWTWSVGPAFLRTPLDVPPWLVPAGVAIVSLGLLVLFVWQLREGPRVALFSLCWYLVTLAPVLPLRDHVTEYYVYIPLIGICWLSGWAFAEAWRSGPRAKFAATSLALLYVFLVLPRSAAGSEWNYQLTERVRGLVEGVARVHELHTGKTILLDGVDTDLFYNGILDHPFRAIGIDNVYLTPGSERRIDAHPDWGDIDEFVLPSDVAFKGLDTGGIVVYDVTGPRLKNITTAYAGLPRLANLPQRVDVGSTLTAYLLGPEWYAEDGNHRWMPKRASLRIGGPTASGQKLYLQGNCSPADSKNDPIVVTVTVDGSLLAPAGIRPGDSSFDLSFPLPDAVQGKKEMQVVVEVNRTFRVAGDTRDLGLAFGAIEVR